MPPGDPPYTFVTERGERAVGLAGTAADSKDVDLMGRRPFGKPSPADSARLVATSGFKHRWNALSSCEFSRRELERLRRHLPGRNRTLGPSTAAEAWAITQRPHA